MEVIADKGEEDKAPQETPRQGAPQEEARQDR
jgi:hypothetical protein